MGARYRVCLCKATGAPESGGADGSEGLARQEVRSLVVQALTVSAHASFASVVAALMANTAEAAADAAAAANAAAHQRMQGHQSTPR